MSVTDVEIERLARTMIAQHGPGAARAATDRINTMIDRGNWHGRDVWARVVRCIHDRQRSVGPLSTGGSADFGEAVRWP